MTQKLVVNLDFEEFPPEYTCRGANRSPAIRIEGILPNIKSLAILATTSPEEGASRVAWVLWNLPAVALIPEGFPEGGTVESPLHAVQGTNDFGTLGYRGPCPEAGAAEAYLFRVYTLDIDIALAPGATWEEMVRAMDGSMNQSGEAVVFATG
ncbi:YbhB/YbcL family Raf kinase inhibitor-like protein [Methanoculleus sp. FWC-SCC3]|uniref:YbhB/YbcL family Raf kinase inhibitor-like protein n=1 Tax=Methanoculleus methanifontis TaxID=2584086 RepID=A0ABT8M2Z8_9EURY|nr:YbhB/YbcL family Raf kinase inhibitor-like protein [Methanoculleus sp. FWC-SCC3]MDN7012093.1 YbhB/YbcL family Raf kinase inhibitor-like protein [Methanoculleus sp. FWC-SCC3]